MSESSRLLQIIKEINSRRAKRHRQSSDGSPGQPDCDATLADSPVPDLHECSENLQGGISDQKELTMQQLADEFANFVLEVVMLPSTGVKVDRPERHSGSDHKSIS